MQLKLCEGGGSELKRFVTQKDNLKGFVEGRIGSGHTPATYGVLSCPREIDDYVFPLPCVVKPTHSSQKVLILTDNQPNRSERGLLKEWLRHSYFSISREPNYRKLEPRVIVEELLSPDGEVPPD